MSLRATYSQFEIPIIILLSAHDGWKLHRMSTAILTLPSELT